MRSSGSAARPTIRRCGRSPTGWSASSTGVWSTDRRIGKTSPGRGPLTLPLDISSRGMSTLPPPRGEGHLRRFAGVRPVLQTPFGNTADQPILYDALGSLAARMLDFDIDGLVILGLASEAWALTEKERDAVSETVGAYATRTSIVAGIDGTTAVAVDRARRAVRYGASSLMVLPPRGATVDQLVTHFCRVADAGGGPILIQDSPPGSGAELGPPAFVRLAEAHPLLCAAKVEGPGAGPKVSRLGEAGIEGVAGWGGLHYPESLRRGAIRCMPGSHLGAASTRMDRPLRG